MGAFRILAGLAFATISVLANSASSDDIEIAGEMLHVPVLDGYCKLDRQKPDEAQFMDGLNRYRTDRLVIIHLMRCDMLELQRGGTYIFDNHLVIVSARARDGVVARSNVPRADFLKRLQNSIPPIDHDAVEHLLKGDLNRVRSLRASGLLEADDNAVYLGEMVADSNTYLVAYTLLRGMAIIVESIDSGLPSGFEPRLVVLRPFMTKLVEGNP